MIPKILIIGYQRSGTTLLRRLMQAHPVVHRMFHERWILCEGGLEMLSGFVWGEKIAYSHSREENKFDKPAVVVYCEMWKKEFGSDAKILHILRHPLDCALSVANLGWAKSAPHALENYAEQTEKVFKFLPLQDEVYFTFKFEDLIYYKGYVLKKILAHCCLDHRSVIIDQIINMKLDNLGTIGTSKLNEGRALAYKSWRKNYSDKLVNGKKQWHKLNIMCLNDNLHHLLAEVGSTSYVW